MFFFFNKISQNMKWDKCSSYKNFESQIANCQLLYSIRFYILLHLSIHRFSHGFYYNFCPYLCPFILFYYICFSVRPFFHSFLLQLFFCPYVCSTFLFYYSCLCPFNVRLFINPFRLQLLCPYVSPSILFYYSCFCPYVCPSILSTTVADRHFCLQVQFSCLFWGEFGDCVHVHVRHCRFMKLT